jgi:hypothetical protein
LILLLDGGNGDNKDGDGNDGGGDGTLVISYIRNPLFQSQKSLMTITLGRKSIHQFTRMSNESIFKQHYVLISTNVLMY